MIIYDSWFQQPWIEPRRPEFPLPFSRICYTQTDNSYQGGLWEQKKGEPVGTPEIGDFDKQEIGIFAKLAGENDLICNDSEDLGIGFNYSLSAKDILRRRRKHGEYLKAVYAANPSAKTIVYSVGGFPFSWFRGEMYLDNQRQMESNAKYLFDDGRYYAAGIPTYLESSDPMGSLLQAVDHLARLRSLGVRCIPYVSLMLWDNGVPVSPVPSEIISLLMWYFNILGCEGAIRWESPNLPYDDKYKAVEDFFVSISGIK